MQQVSGHRGRVAAVAGVVLALVLLAGCGGASTAAPAPVPASASPTPAAQAPVDGRTLAVQAVAPLAKSTPTRVQVPDIGVDSTLVALGLNPDHTVEVPPLNRSEQAGYYKFGPTPGAEGPAVVLGHIDGGGKKGVFYRLQEMTTGQKIEVTRADGRTATFTVTRVQRVDKDSFPTDEVYGTTSDAELRLISCGGALDRRAHSYLDNIIVFATLTGSSQA